MPKDSNTQTGVVLYYPYMHFQDINWLKLLLLYWEKVTRIVPIPLDGELEDSPVVRDLVTERVIFNTPPDSFIPGAARSFRERILPYLENPSSPGSDVVLGVLREIDHVPLSLDATHAMKMPSSLWDEMKRCEGTIIDGHELTSDNLGGLYMLCLAAEMSDGIGAGLQTDTVGYDGCGAYLRFGQPPQLAAGSHAPHALFNLDIDFPTPAQLQHVPITKIVEFRTRYAGERARFREMIEGILGHARTMDNVPALQDYLASQVGRIQETGKEYRARLLALGLSAAAKLFKVSVPALVVGAASAMIIPEKVVEALGVIGVTVFSADWVVSLRNDYRSLGADHPARYAALVRRRFGP